ncbi:MAG: M56 family metallopeptidase [Pseudobutyrivibrio sp.]|nr:M56 family metallopeptidase [Pseudobutyrivibrio sp.]
MGVTEFSIVSTIIWSSIIIVAMSLLRTKYRFVNICGASGMVLLYLFCGIRMLVPIDFPWTVCFNSPVIYNKLHECLNIEIIINNFHFYIKDLLTWAWAVGIIIGFIELLIEYDSFDRKIKKLNKSLDIKLTEAIKLLQEKQGGKNYNKIRVYRSGDVNSPFGCGIIDKKIFIPNRDYSELNINNILLHEYMHHKNGDIKIKLLVNVLCVLYWWNPLVYMLKYNMESYFEMRCDLEVVNNMDNSAIADYLQTIVSEVSYAAQLEKNSAIVGMLGKKSEVGLKERFRAIELATEQQPVKVWRNITLILTIFVFAISYSFILLPGYPPKVDDYGDGVKSYEVSPDNAYIVHEGKEYYLWTDFGDKTSLDKDNAEMLLKNGFELREE